MEYAIVDIETTGGHASGNGITEIAIYIHDGREVIQRYETLVDPLQDIPVYITALTGIDNDMVRRSPSFSSIAQQVYELLKGRVFVAHNVNFDYSFVKHQLQGAGYEYSAPKLCTVRLSRTCWSGLQSYSLGKLCRSLEIPLTNQHRAGGDTAATAILFSKILGVDGGKHVVDMLKKQKSEQKLPPHLPKNAIDALPSGPGVYYFKDQKGKVIYVGKAVDIKKRVLSHFTGHNPNPQRQHFLREIHSVDFERCGTELMALLLEAVEIKRLWPSYNRAIKRFEPIFGLYSYEDQQGYIRLAVDKHKKLLQSHHSFNRQIDGVNLLHRLVNEYGLCSKLCSLQKRVQSCVPVADHICSGACRGDISPALYNIRVKAALNGMAGHLPSLAVLDKGCDEDQQSCVWVDKGKFYGMGYVDRYADIIEISELKSVLTRYPGNDYMVRLIMDYAEKNPRKVVWVHKPVTELESNEETMLESAVE